MRVEEVWRLLAQSMNAMADHVANGKGYGLTPVAFDDLPDAPKVGTIMCVNNSLTNTWGAVIAGGTLPATIYTVLAFYNGTNWTVIGK